jgi:hypothetical protein
MHQGSSAAALSHLPEKPSLGEATKLRRQSRQQTHQPAPSLEHDAGTRTRKADRPPPLVAHLTIHWAYTDVGDDPDGKLFAKLREGLDKWLKRRGITGGLTAIWVRERRSRGQAEVVHCHMLFHLPMQFRSGKGLREVEAAIYRLVNGHGRRDGDKRLPWVAHLTIHWAYTDVGDGPDGKLFAKFHEGLDKWAQRHGFALTGIWARERLSRGQAEAVHCHLLFHLPMQFRSGKGLREVEAAIYRLVNGHGRRDGDKSGDGYWAEEVIKLVIHENPDGKYFIKRGGPEVWKLFSIRKEHRRSQGIIHGKTPRHHGEHRTRNAKPLVRVERVQRIEAA